MIFKIYFNKLLFFTCIGLFLFCFKVSAQADTSSFLDEKMESYHKTNFKERLFVHIDKSFYLSGENIWMKFYLTDALLHMPSNLSKLVYVEIVNKHNKSVLRYKFQLENGFGDGSFILPDNFLSGNYTLRAYTHWMRNEGPDAFFEQEITVVNTLDDAAKPANTISKSKIGFQFFPEGGNLIVGVESKIAFKATNEFEEGLECNGIILNDRNDTLVSFSSFKMGMGNFMFKPIFGEHYNAIIKIKDSVLKPNIPLIQNSGYSLHLMDDNSDTIFIKVKMVGANVEENLYLLHHGVQFSRKCQVQQTISGEVNFKISRQELYEGVNRFTIFNNTLKPVCERSYFTYPENKLSIKVTTNQEVFEPRSIIKVGLNTNNDFNINESSNLSMSVFLMDSIQASSYLQDIESYMLLTSALKGVVQSPSFYFDTINTTKSSRYKAIDNLMLTQGWSSYIWENGSRQSSPNLYLPEVEGPIIHSNIFHRNTNLPAKNVLTYFTVPGNRFYFASSKSNDKGEMLFNLKSDLDANEAIVQAEPNLTSAYRISILDPFESRFTERYKKLFSISSKYKSDLLKRSIASQAERIYIKTLDVKQFKLKLPDTLAFFGKPTSTYYLDDYTRFTSMQELIQEYVKELKVKKKGNDFSIVLWNNKYNMFSQSSPFMMIDGVPIFNTNKLFTFDPLKIKKIDILSKVNLTGSMFNDGVVNYSTYNGDLANFPIDHNALVMEYKGAQQTKQFYSPSYPNTQSKNSSMPDLRSVLHWEPYIYVNNKDEKQISFYSADLNGKYAIVVQGLSEKGLLGSTIKYITIK
jgi:hypothetical protein